MTFSTVYFQIHRQQEFQSQIHLGQYIKNSWNIVCFPPLSETSNFLYYSSNRFTSNTILSNRFIHDSHMLGMETFGFSASCNDFLLDLSFGWALGFLPSLLYQIDISKWGPKDIRVSGISPNTFTDTAPNKSRIHINFNHTQNILQDR